MVESRPSYLRLVDQNRLGRNCYELRSTTNGSFLFDDSDPNF